MSENVRILERIERKRKKGTSREIMVLLK